MQALFNRRIEMPVYKCIGFTANGGTFVKRFKTKKAALAYLNSCGDPNAYIKGPE